MTLAVSQSKVTLRAARKIARTLRLEEGRKRAPFVVLRRMASAVAAFLAGLGAVFKAAGPLRSIVGTQRPKLPSLSMLLVVPTAQAFGAGRFAATLEGAAGDTLLRFEHAFDGTLT